jgi:nucleoprotein TPR
MKANADDLAHRLAETIQAKEDAEAELVNIRSKLADAMTENKTHQSQSADLGLQVRVLTREIAIRDDPALAYESFDPFEKDRSEISDIDAVITNNLTAFKKLPQLLEQNKKLLRISRELGRKLEENSSSSSAGKNATDDDLDNAAQAIENLTETVNSLRAQVVDSRTQLDLSIKERDMYGRLLVQGRMLGMSSETVDRIASGNDSSEGRDQDDVVRNVLSGIQNEFEKHREDLRNQVKQVQDQVEEKAREVEAERERTASALASLRHEQSKFLFDVWSAEADCQGNIDQNLALTQKMEQEKSDLATHLSTIAIREAEILNLRTELSRIIAEENQLRVQKNHLQTFVDGLNAQKEMLQVRNRYIASSGSSPGSHIMI